MVLAVRDDRLLQGDSSMGRDNAPSVQKRKCSPPWEPATRGFPSLGEGGGGAPSSPESDVAVETLEIFTG